MGAHSRRLFLLLGGAALAGALLPAQAAHTPDTSLSLVRARWREVTLGPPTGASARAARLGAAAARHLDGMRPTGASLWPGLAFPSFEETPERLRAMARAYALPGTGLTGDPRLAFAVAAGLDHYRRHVYAAGADPAGNWWHWQIGVPRTLLDAALLIGPHLPAVRPRRWRRPSTTSSPKTASTPTRAPARAPTGWTCAR